MEIEFAHSIFRLNNPAVFSCKRSIARGLDETWSCLWGVTTSHITPVFQLSTAVRLNIALSCLSIYNIWHWKLQYWPCLKDKSAFYIVSASSPLHENVGLSGTCVEAGIINIVHKERNEVVKYSKNPILYCPRLQVLRHCSV